MFSQAGPTLPPLLGERRYLLMQVGVPAVCLGRIPRLYSWFVPRASEREDRSWGDKVPLNVPVLGTAHTCRGLACGGRRQPWTSVLTFHLPGRVPGLSAAVHIRLAGLCDSEDSLVSVSNVAAEALGVQTLTAGSGLS